MTDKEYVKEHWVNCHSFDHTECCGDENGEGTWRVSLEGTRTPWRKSEGEAWYAAAEYTRNRLEEIRCMESEIRMVRFQCDRAAFDSMKVIDGTCCTLSRELEGAYASCSFRWARILSRLESILADLKRGMKEAA
jgi:hypothetical protein